MYEMLGNQFYLARNYSRAIESLEIALTKDRRNKAVQRKLVVCYTQTGRVDRAFELFLDLMKKDIDFIIKTDPLDDDCLCNELVFKIEKKLSVNENSLDYHLILGILYLYCNLEKSLGFFLAARNLDPQNPRILSVIKKLRKYIKQNISN